MPPVLVPANYISWECIKAYSQMPWWCKSMMSQSMNASSITGGQLCVGDILVGESSTLLSIASRAISDLTNYYLTNCVTAVLL